MVDAVDHGVEDGGGEDAVAADEGEVGGALAAQSDGSFAFGAADAFAEGGVFDEEADGEEVEACVEGGAGGDVGVLEEVGGKGYEARYWGFGLLVLELESDEVEAK